mgnify:CR=1 FL=1|jgi:biotin synthase
MKRKKEIIDELEREQCLPEEGLRELLSTKEKETLEYLRQRAEAVRQSVYGNQVYIRGLIEFTNYCKNDCYYCGIRRSNSLAERYRLSREEILSCCKMGYELGFRTFVLQGGEDGYYTDERLCEIIRAMKSSYPDCAVTMSVGERDRESYEAMYRAGADRYLLRHETADEAHYGKLHPKELTRKSRMECLRTLKEIGYQVGCGFMVGSPYQTTDTLIQDLLFIKEFKPHMVGIGPFIPHKDTPFRDEAAGTLEMTLRLLSIIRLMHPLVLLPATTALGTIDANGRELGILAGANVVMPNLSPREVRGKYLLYDNKICTGDEAAECRFCMEKRMEKIGYQVVVDRGDYIAYENPGSGFS